MRKPAPQGPKPKVLAARFPGPTVLWQFREATATSYSEAPLNMWGLNLNQAFCNFLEEFLYLAAISRLNYESYQGAVLSIPPITSTAAEHDFAAGQFVL